ncbi:MAG: hypothetical protein J6Q50_05240 [Clostridia bacterium]|nr:hypothetical protein [Clostridia bacterium]
MKKVISIILVAIMLFSFAACGEKTNENTPTGAPVNKEELKKGWKEGVLTFVNGKTISLPCTIDEIVKTSEFSIPSLQTMANTFVEPGSEKSLLLVGPDINISIKCKNKTDEPIKVAETTVVGYTVNRTKEGNSKIKFANTLTVNASRVDVEEVLGVDENDEKNGFSKYTGRNNKNQKVEMRVSYDSNNLVNSVAFEIK